MESTDDARRYIRGGIGTARVRLKRFLQLLPMAKIVSQLKQAQMLLSYLLWARLRTFRSRTVSARDEVWAR